VKITAPEGPIQPGASGKISVSVTTAYWKTIKYRKEIQLVTNDPLKPHITFTILANIHEILSTTPAYVNFGQVKPGSKTTKEFTLVNTGKDPIKISQIVANPASQMTISPRKRVTLKAGGQIHLMVTFTAGKNPGIVNGSILIKSDLSSLPEKPIFVQAEVITGK
jgi:HYDIN/CFA65/VesB-like, Ig-like domain